MLLDRERGLLNAAIDWAAEMGNRSWRCLPYGPPRYRRIPTEPRPRIDIFGAAMLGLTEVVKSFLTLQPTLIDAKGPHGFSLHFHAQVGQDAAKTTLEYLQSVKEIELKTVPFLKK